MKNETPSEILGTFFFRTIPGMLLILTFIPGFILGWIWFTLKAGFVLAEDYFIAMIKFKDRQSQ